MTNKHAKQPATTVTAKKRFRVRAELTHVFCICVEADSELEALDIAESADGCYFDEDYSHEWEVFDAHEDDDIHDEEMLSASAFNTI